METEFPHDVADVKTGLTILSQRDALVASDELMARRPPHSTKDLRYLIEVWRRDRVSWRDSRDARQDKKDAEE